MTMKRANKQTIKVLCDLLELLKGNRGTYQGNPYFIPEVKAALKHLADLQGIDPKDWLDAVTKMK